MSLPFTVKAFGVLVYSSNLAPCVSANAQVQLLCLYMGCFPCLQSCRFDRKVKKELLCLGDMHLLLEIFQEVSLGSSPYSFPLSFLTISFLAVPQLH